MFVSVLCVCAISMTVFTVILGLGGVTPILNLRPLPLHPQIHGPSSRKDSVAVARVKLIYLWGWKLSEWMET